MTLIAIGTLVSSSYAQEMPESRTKVIVANFAGLATDGYIFTDNVSNRDLKFEKIEGDRIGEINLLDPAILDNFFRVTYRIEYVKNEAKKDMGKLSKTKSPFARKLSIIQLDALPDFQNDEEYEDEDDGGKDKDEK